MLLHRHPHSSRRFIVTIICTVITLFHQIEGFPVLVKKAGVVLGSPALPILPNSDASWFHDSAAVSNLVTRSSDDVVHDSLFIPTIATMGVLVIICIFCSYKLIVGKGTARLRGAYIQGPIYSTQNTVGHVESSHGSSQQEIQSLQQYDPLQGFLRSSVAETISTPVSSYVSYYAAPPEARRRSDEFFFAPSKLGASRSFTDLRLAKDLAKQPAKENKRAEQKAKPREAEAQARDAESKRQEEEAGNAAFKAQEEEERAKENLEQTKAWLSIGIQPVVWPTEEEFNLTRTRIEYNSNKVHLAICGSSGAGKSSLINAFRGFANHDPGAAPAGVVETTKAIDRYPDARDEFPHSHFVWFDVPGAGTLDISGWQYFNNQGLFIFDVIILVYDARFTEIDVAIIKNCERYRIPLYIVRSKADTHIRNIMEKIQPDSDDEDAIDSEECYKQAQQIFIDSTRRDLEKNLQDALLSKRDVFIVSSIVMRALVTKRCNSKISNMMIDEARFLEAVSKEAYARLGKDYSTVVERNMIRAGT